MDSKSSFQKLIKSIYEIANDGKSFEHFSKWFLLNHPFWKNQVDKVWLWKDWPKRWGPDNGIDLVMLDKLGRNWAVQSKCYNPEYQITKANSAFNPLPLISWVTIQFSNGFRDMLRKIAKIKLIRVVKSG